MRSYIFFFLFCMLFAGKAWAQDNIFQDDFIDNTNNWWVSTVTGSYSAAIQDGKYLIDRTALTSHTQFYSSKYLDPQKDFSMEAIMTQLEGVENHGYGLLWGAKDVANCNFFIVTSNGNFQIFSYIDGQTFIRKEWTKLDSIHPIGRPNKLAIKKAGLITTFYLNDQLLTAIPNITCAGAQLGFELNLRMKIEVDKITVKQDAGPINLFPGMPVGLKKENLGMNVNTIYPEKAPVISPDGKILFFNRDDTPENTGHPDQTDIYYSELNPDNTWSKAKNMGFPLNNNGHNSVVSITPDNNTLFIMNTYNSDGSSKSGGFSISHRTPKGWSIPEDIVMKNFYTRSMYQTAFLGNDRTVMLTTLSRDGGYGFNDIYVCFLNADGTWSEPTNIGGVVNTFCDEAGPFLASDNITMYYSTQGKAGYGSNDIFVTKRLDDSWTRWSEPQNLGPEINTSKFDAYYQLPASSEFAYMCSESESIGKLDIIRVKIPKTARPNPVVLIKGRVVNAKTKEPVAADITYEILELGKEVGLAQSNPTSGEYKIVLPYGINYGYRAIAKGYLSVNEHFDLTDKKEYTEVNKDLYLVPIEIGESIVLNNVFFVQSKAELLSSSYPELDRLSLILIENPNIEIQVSGHTDSQGDPKLNLQLSEKRAATVKSYLVQKGLSAKRITEAGYGGTRPIASNAGEQTRKLNRRVEFTITKK